MSFGISLQTSTSASALGGADALSFVMERALEAEAAGVDDIWLNQGLDLDGITVAALVAREVPRVIIGIAAVPMYPRHPVVLASQAKAAQLAAGGRFTLGIGLGHQAQVEGVFGVPFDRPSSPTARCPTSPGPAPWPRSSSPPSAPPRRPRAVRRRGSRPGCRPP
ncbi:MAG TPA: LLM class flavin-dependent oxidoreductase [Trebonia sp.]|jgi:alkanesulfonate monooxygenase SsuD/methylene tetrahydromethanopterin reductase-like flavin-dependent oxidoreductase (luciferase family)